jgi:hypothetical protein
MKYINHTPTWKDFKIWIAFLLLLVVIPGWSGYYFRSENPAVLVPLLFLIGFFIFNLVVRGFLSSKNYFTHPYNLLTSKFFLEKTMDIPRELMFEKMIEVIDQSDFKLADADPDKFEILATTRITWTSWGENLYISFEEMGAETIMKFCSVTLFQIYSWGKNEKNYADLLEEFETSLTI